MPDALERLRAALAERYRIDREVGSGGMATVYMAEDIKHQRQVAIKVLKPELAATVGTDRFLQEIKIAARLEHPHILTLIDSGETAGFLYYVMPFVEGESLRDKLDKKGELPIPEAVRLLRDIVDALSHAHARGVVHRDIKPENVMVSDRHALVMDFGVAKALSDASERSHLTSAGIALGTPAYMSPEQAVADSNVDHRADIYAVGALAYELLAGRPPFNAVTPQEMLAAHVTAPPEPLAQHRLNVSPALASLVMRCLEKRPADRWQKTEELLSQLEAVATPSGGMTPTATRPLVAFPRVGRKFKFAALAVLIAAVLSVAAVRFLSSNASTLVPERVLVAAFSNETGDPSLDPVGKIVADWLARGIQETRLVEVVDPRTAVFSNQAEQGEPDGVVPRDVAEEMGAGTMVTGVYYQRGDSLEFHAQVTETRTGKLLQPVAPVRGSIDDPTQGIETLGQSVMASIAALFSEELGTLGQGFRPPANYAAYREYVAGVEQYTRGDFMTAASHLYRAVRMDTTFYAAGLWLAAMHWGGGRPAIADSITTELGRSRDRLTEVERHTLACLEEVVQRDFSPAYRACREAYTLAPRSTELGWGTALLASYDHRPREVIEILATVDPTKGFLRGFPAYWGFLTVAHHLLGQYDRELEEARRGRRQHPDLFGPVSNEARALGAMGRVADINALMEETLQFPLRGNWSPGEILWTGGQELRAHGYPTEGRAMLERALDMFRELPPEPRDPTYELYNAGGTLYLLERWDEARSAFDKLVADFPDNTNYLGSLGVAAARQGQRGTALAVSDSLEAVVEPYYGGFRTLWRARIAAVLGEREEALRLVRNAFAQGATGRWILSHSSDFETLRGEPQFEELVRPKG